MNQDPVRVSQIHWTRTFPLLRVFEAASRGCGLSALILAVAAMLASWTGSHLIIRMFDEPSNARRLMVGFPHDDLSRWKDDSAVPTPAPLPPWKHLTILPASVDCLQSASAQLFLHPSRHLLLSFRSSPNELPWTLTALLTVWNALIVGSFGVAIARITATQFCINSRTGLVEAVRFAVRYSRHVLLFSGLVVAFLTVFRVFLWMAGTVAQAGRFPLLAVNLIWGVILLTAVFLLLLFLVSCAAWLLSVAAIGTDRCSGADALSRSYSYVLSHRTFTIVGILGVTAVALGVRWLLEWIYTVAMSTLPGELQQSGSNVVRRSWTLMAEIIPDAAQLSVFLTGTTILYVLLRQKEDGIQIDEIDGAA